ncbi:hypothetical protein QA596_05335 [Balneolales bacterium ANBcel1]|nr:hypothetical protein [Balneolales bacterium ANBcel1]
MYSSDNNRIWDEFEWESHINEMARRHEHLRQLIESDHGNRPRWLSHINDFPTKLDAVDAFIEEELLLEESHFPVDDEDEFESEQDDALFELLDDGEEEDDIFGDDEDDPEIDFFQDSGDDEEDDMDDDQVEEMFEQIFDEETREPTGYDYASLENIAIYTDARDLSADLLLFNDSQPRYMQHPGFIRLVSDTLQISSKLAAAYSMGFDVEVLGANIAYCKKALAHANHTLAHLQSLKGNPVQVADYYELHRRLFELRNNIAIHIQDTRAFFAELM